MKAQMFCTSSYTYKHTWNIIGGYIDTKLINLHLNMNPSTLLRASHCIPALPFIISSHYLTFISTITRGKGTMNLRFCTMHPQENVSECGLLMYQLLLFWSSIPSKVKDKQEKKFFVICEIELPFSFPFPASSPKKMGPQDLLCQCLHYS